MSEDTIYALSTAPGRAGVAVIRISGRLAATALKELAGVVPPPRLARLATIRDPANGELLDRTLVLYFPEPHSFTGEDVVEMHVHGGRAIIAGVLKALGERPNLRPAEPGEFVRRAFLAGKMDLAETEALSDLLDAETAAQRRQALRGLDNGLGVRAEAWRSRLIEAQALAEADIDFPDEGDVPSGLADRARAEAAQLREDIDAVLALPDGSRLRDGAVVVIAGPPNAGKSSFMNWVARREIAIVTPYAGTTRDLLELPVDLDGYPATFIDTAGFRDATDPVEVEALRRAAARASEADLVLWFSEGPETDSAPNELAGIPLWLVRTKADQAADPAGSRIAISTTTGKGIAELTAQLTRHLADTLAPQETSLVTRQRHRVALTEASAALARAGAVAEAELIAEELRNAAQALGRISGRVDVEDVLNSVFGSFCIGK